MTSQAATRAVLLRKQQLVFLDDQSTGEPLPASYLEAISAQLAALGYVLSTRLAARLQRLTAPALADVQQWLWTTLAAQLGAHVKHEPLFRSFPHDIPRDTRALYVRKVLAYYCQDPSLPCLFCGERGTTHVLSCGDVVCERCWDGANYSACPVCQRHVDRSSPFFRPSEPMEPGIQSASFKRLDLGHGMEAAARALLVSFCTRAQPLTPDDKTALGVIVGDAGERALAWLPEQIAVRETAAAVIGQLLRVGDPARVLAAARPYLRTATDVLRLIAAYSGHDPALLSRKVLVERPVAPGGRWQGAAPARRLRFSARPERVVAVSHQRFKVAKLSRPLRRALLGALAAMDPDALVEDMLRHARLWVWLGEFLHPGEHAKAFPEVAAAFAAVRGGPVARPTFAQRAAAAATSGDARAYLGVIRPRAGELGRRFDHALRLAGGDAVVGGEIVEAFRAAVPALKTPMLLTLHAHLATRRAPVAVRVYWPKAAAALGITGPDLRPPLQVDAIASGRRAIEDELLARFGKLPRFAEAVLDAELRDIVVPFVERSAARSAIALPRGSHLAVPPSKVVRMFLHWCEPEKRGSETDLDLSVAFYDEKWQHAGLCSYYSLVYPTGVPESQVIARSAGDLCDAPWPDGASELVDLDRAGARALGIRYAVMVVNAYAGMPFSALARGFAGLMLRESAGGPHFDPQTVQLRFDLQGEHGVYMPLVFDLATDRMHWLDVQAKGEIAMNNVASSEKSITTICPALIGYFGSGARASMFELAAMHAAARCSRVHVRDAAGAVRTIVRAPDEAPRAFLARIAALAVADGAASAAPGTLPSAAEPVFAALLRGDLPVHPSSTVYALFPDLPGPRIAAAELLVT